MISLKQQANTSKNKSLHLCCSCNAGSGKIINKNAQGALLLEYLIFFFLFPHHLRDSLWISQVLCRFCCYAVSLLPFLSSWKVAVGNLIGFRKKVALWMCLCVHVPSVLCHMLLSAWLLRNLGNIKTAQNILNVT